MTLSITVKNYIIHSLLYLTSYVEYVYGTIKIFELERELALLHKSSTGVYDLYYEIEPCLVNTSCDGQLCPKYLKAYRSCRDQSLTACT